MGLDRLSLSRNKKIEFWKLLGTGKGETFTPKDADIQRWGLLITIPESELGSFDSSKLVKRWHQKSLKRYRVVLKNISVQGKWSKAEPFKSNLFDPPWNGKIVALTRARIKWLKNPIFWRSVPPVTVSLKSATGLISAIELVKLRLDYKEHFQYGNQARQFVHSPIKVRRTRLQSLLLHVKDGTRRNYLRGSR